MANGFKINSGSSIVKNGTDGFQRAVLRLQPQFIDEMLREIRKMDTKSGGILSDSKKNREIIATIRAKVRKALDKAGYFNNVKSFLVNFDQLGNFNRFIHERENDIKVTKGQLSPFKKFATDKVLFDLQKQGLDAQIVQPIKDSLRQAVNLGGSLTDMINNVENTLRQGKNGLLGSRAIQASRDSLGQYDGIVNQAIKDRFNLDAIRYIGSIIETSRAQCIRWVDMGTLLFDELDNEIQWAFNNGSGMIEGTTSRNFLQNRGGYGCRHTAIPTRKRK